ncbi:T9SS type A sorting domain-containing protein [Botryobacter ruber]|uniref:T9SS type A sorting domain-containing protein n=1 Tax=Botryobacter ruber TaxID=2171629 RepID=UPI000E0AA585|nr:T9SS type A sorting domain-containing protein [Botryobacter ruber]
MKKFTVLMLFALLLSFNLTAQQETNTPGFTSVTNLTPLPIVRHTADKPQSKVWSYAGKHWAVLPDNTGTHIWRLDSITWTNVLTISSSTSTRADCKVVGDVVHILLFRGTSAAYLLSAEFVPETKTYKLWSQRAEKAELLLDPVAETATLDIDGKGRMWVAYDAESDVKVQWSDPPYAVWNAPVTVASGIKEDDICTVIALPGKIGVFWSNQVTQRFGFKTHTDGAAPTSWSADEVPASQSAFNVGKGMADDHLNLVAAKDGTLYCAVKTSFDKQGYPMLGLLVRRPSGTWDDMYQVSDTEGTRPVVILNEVIGKLKVIYTAGSFGGEILYRVSPTSHISFSSPLTLIGGAYNYATSVKASYSSEVVILASTSSEAVGVLATDPSPVKDELLGNIYVYPNPISSTGIVSFALPEGGEYRILLYNSNGDKIKGLEGEGVAVAGELYTTQINCAHLASGLYIVRLQTSKGTKHFKLILDK